MPSERVAHNALDILRIKELEHHAEVRKGYIAELEHHLNEKQKLIDQQAWELTRIKGHLAKKGVRKSELQRKDARIRELKFALEIEREVSKQLQVELNEHKNHSDIIAEEGLGYD